MGAVLDQNYVVSTAHGADGRHVHGHPTRMDDDHGPCARADPFLQRSYGDTAVVRFDVGEYRGRPAPSDRCGNHDERAGGDHDLVIGGHAHGQQRQFQSGSARGDREEVADAEVGSQFRFRLARLAVVGIGIPDPAPPAGMKHARQRILLIGVPLWPDSRSSVWLNPLDMRQHHLARPTWSCW